MFMRFRGGGVGHKATRDWDVYLQSDQHEPDEDNELEHDVEMVDEELIELDDDIEQHGSDSDTSSADEIEERADGDRDELDDEDILAEEGYGTL